VEPGSAENGLLRATREGRGPSFVRPALFLVVEQALTLATSVIVGVVVGVIFILPRVLQSGALDQAALVQDARTMLTQGWVALAVSLIGFLVIIACTYGWVKWVERRPFRSVGLVTRRPLLEWMRGMLFGAGMMIVTAALIGFTGGLRWEGVAAAGVGPALLWTVVTLAFYLIQGPAEEVMARGYLMPTLGARGGVWLGVVVSSLIFAAEHLLNPNMSVLAVLNLFLYGVFAALYALREEGLWGIFGFHTAWNWMQGSVLGMAVSGANLSPAPLFSLTLTGPAWWSGDAFGPEGGLAASLPLLAGIGALLLWKAGPLTRAAAPAVSQGAAPAVTGADATREEER